MVWGILVGLDGLGASVESLRVPGVPGVRLDIHRSAWRVTGGVLGHPGGDAWVSLAGSWAVLCGLWEVLVGSLRGPPTALSRGPEEIIMFLRGPCGPTTVLKVYSGSAGGLSYTGSGLV